MFIDVSLAARTATVVIDDDLALGWIQSMQTSDILCERSFPRDRHGEKQRVEPGIIETFADVAPRSDQHPLVRCGNISKPLHSGPSLLRSYSAGQNDDVARETGDPPGQEQRMVLALSQNYW